MKCFKQFVFCPQLPKRILHQARRDCVGQWRRIILCLSGIGLKLQVFFIIVPLTSHGHEATYLHSLSLYFLVHSVPYKENMVLRCAQISIGLDSLEDSVSLTLIFWSLTLVHVLRIRVLLVLFHLVWFLVCSFWHWSIWGDSHSPCWTITPVPCFPVLLPPPYTRATLLWFHSSRSSDW